MEFSNFGDGERARPMQPAQTQRRAVASAPSNIEAIITSLAAQVRQLNARIQAIEASIPRLASNDKTTADFVNRLNDNVQTASTQIKQCVAVLRRFSRGGGVQPAQFVPRASDAVVAYDTPQSGMVEAQAVQPGTGPGASAEPLDPGSEATEVSYEDAVFHGLIDDDE